jgi:hypothetical protein
LMGEALRYRLDPDGEISQFLQSRFQAWAEWFTCA